MAEKIGISSLKKAPSTDAVCATNIPMTNAALTPTIATSITGIGANECLEDFTAVANGVLTVFTLSHTPTLVNRKVRTINTAEVIAGTDESSVVIVYNGNTLLQGAGNDYTVSGLTVTMLFAPATTTTSFYIKYRY